MFGVYVKEIIYCRRSLVTPVGPLAAGADLATCIGHEGNIRPMGRGRPLQGFLRFPAATSLSNKSSYPPGTIIPAPLPQKIPLV